MLHVSLCVKSNSFRFRLGAFVLQPALKLMSILDDYEVSATKWCVAMPTSSPGNMIVYIIATQLLR